MHYLTPPSRMRRFLLLILIVIATQQISSGATFSTLITANGPWRTAANWNGAYPGCCTFNSNDTYNIYGKITVGTIATFESLSLQRGLLNVEDTLVIYGDLIIGNNGSLNLANGSVLIVYGNVSIANQVTIAANSYFIIMGNFTKTGSAGQGSFTSDDHPSNVFIGGTIDVPSGWASSGSNDVLNCNLSQEHTSSTCNYGNSVDLEEDPISDLVNDLICGTGVSGGTIAANQVTCSGNDVAAFTSSANASPGTFTYQWYYSTTSSNPASGTWTAIAGATNTTYDSSPLSTTTYFYRRASKANGCKVSSNALTITVYPRPVTGPNYYVPNNNNP